MGLLQPAVLVGRNRLNAPGRSAGIMQCNYCGAEIPVLYPFSMCPSCGQPLAAPSESAGKAF